MLAFATYFAVTLCSRREGGIDRLTDLFGRLFQNFTATDGIGGWVGAKVVETERNRTIATWGCEWPTVSRALKYCRWYQVAERQEAISIQFCTPGTGWQARIVETPQDWADLERELRTVFNPLPQSGLEGLDERLYQLDY